MNHVGQETVVTIGDKKYTLSRFTRKLMRQYLEWADTVLPNPLEVIKASLTGFPPNLQELMVKDALERSRLRRSFNSPDIQQLLNTPEGVFRLFSLLLQQYHPDLAEETIEELFDRYIEEQGEAALQDSFRQSSRADAGQ